VNEPGGSGDNSTVDVCVTLDSAPGLIERAGVIIFNTEEGTAGTLFKTLHASELSFGGTTYYMLRI